MLMNMQIFCWKFEILLKYTKGSRFSVKFVNLISSFQISALLRLEVFDILVTAIMYFQKYQTWFLILKFHIFKISYLFLDRNLSHLSLRNPKEFRQNSPLVDTETKILFINLFFTENGLKRHHWKCIRTQFHTFLLEYWYISVVIRQLLNFPKILMQDLNFRFCSAKSTTTSKQILRFSGQRRTVGRYV